MINYIIEFICVAVRHKVVWWGTLILALGIGYGIADDYKAFAASVQASGSVWGGVLPTEILPWWAVVVFAIWLAGSLAHKEVMRKLRAGRVVIGDPIILENITLYKREKDLSSIVGKNDILYVDVSNQPQDFENGREMSRAYGSVSLVDLETNKQILSFDYPRWTDNEKPGYSGNPEDRILDEWKYRTIYPNGEPNRLDLVLKSKGEENAYGFCVFSQREPKWHDGGLAISPGRYRLGLSLSWVGMKEPYKASYEFTNPGANKRMSIRRTDRGLTTPWLGAVS